jgi:hypothetical protein
MLFVKSYCPHHTDCAPAISIFPDNSSGLSDAIEYCVLRIEEGGRVFTIKVFDDEIPIQVPEGMNNASGHEIAAFLLIELHAGLGDILASHLAAFDTYGLSEADESCGARQNQSGFNRLK